MTPELSFAEGIFRLRLCRGLCTQQHEWSWMVLWFWRAQSEIIVSTDQNILNGFLVDNSFFRRKFTAKCYYIKLKVHSPFRVPSPTQEGGKNVTRATRDLFSRSFLLLVRRWPIRCFVAYDVNRGGKFFSSEKFLFCAFSYVKVLLKRAQKFLRFLCWESWKLTRRQLGYFGYSDSVWTK